MSYIRLCLFLLAAGLFCKPINAAPEPISIIDDSGQTLTLPKAATRVITLSPHLTELLFSLELQNRIVATVKFSDYPRAAKRIPRIGDGLQINIERIVELNPDLILSWQSGNNQQQIKKLKDLGFPVYFSEPVYLSDINKNLVNIGILLGEKTKAIVVSKRFQEDLTQITFNYFDKQEKRVFFESWHKPLYTVGGNQIISQIIQLCGGSNIFSDINTKAPLVNIETVIARQPDLIIIGKKNKQSYKDWRQWKDMPAVKNKHLYRINSENIVRQSPAILEGVEEMCQLIDKAR